MITEKQAKALDALRNGGAISTVRERIKADAPAAVVTLWADRLIEREYRMIDGKMRAWYTHTDKGHAAWLASLR